MRVQAGASTWWLYGGVDVRVDASDLGKSHMVSIVYSTVHS